MLFYPKVLEKVAQNVNFAKSNFGSGINLYARRRTGNRCLSAYIGNMDKKKVALSPTIEETLLPAEPDDVLELDEVWSFVQKRANKRWLWTAICRRTRQIVAAVIGDRQHQNVSEVVECDTGIVPMLPQLQ